MWQGSLKIRASQFGVQHWHPERPEFNFGAQLGNTILVVCTNHVGAQLGVCCIGHVLDVFELCFQ